MPCVRRVPAQLEQLCHKKLETNKSLTHLNVSAAYCLCQNICQCKIANTLNIRVVPPTAVHHELLMHFDTQPVLCPINKHCVKRSLILRAPSINTCRSYVMHQMMCSTPPFRQPCQHHNACRVAHAPTLLSPECCSALHNHSAAHVYAARTRHPQLLPRTCSCLTPLLTNLPQPPSRVPLQGEPALDTY
jgi:hypothetical protein